MCHKAPDEYRLSTLLLTISFAKWSSIFNMLKTAACVGKNHIVQQVTNLCLILRNRLLPFYHKAGFVMMQAWQCSNSETCTPVMPFVVLSFIHLKNTVCVSSRRPELKLFAWRGNHIMYGDTAHRLHKCDKKKVPLVCFVVISVLCLIMSPSA